MTTLAVPVPDELMAYLGSEDELVEGHSELRAAPSGEEGS